MLYQAYQNITISERNFSELSAETKLTIYYTIKIQQAKPTNLYNWVLVVVKMIHLKYLKNSKC